MPTASAVVADVIDAARHIDKTKNVDLWDSSGDFVEDSRVLPAGSMSGKRSPVPST